MALSMAGSWRLLANPVTLQYVRKVSKTVYAGPVTVRNCQIKMRTVTHTGEGELLRAASLGANLWRDMLDEAGVGEPKPQDVLMIGSSRYTITAVEHCARAAPGNPGEGEEGQSRRYRCFLLRES
jgi:hypothetical protein